MQAKLELFTTNWTSRQMSLPSVQSSKDHQRSQTDYNGLETMDAHTTCMPLTCETCHLQFLESKQTFQP
jgi:hypothetical protein